MSEDLTQKEILVRLMDKVENMQERQLRHMTFAEGKLQSIEEQAIKTNGRVTVNRTDIDDMKQFKTRVYAYVALVPLFLSYFVSRFL